MRRHSNRTKRTDHKYKNKNKHNHRPQRAAEGGEEAEEVLPHRTRALEPETPPQMLQAAHGEGIAEEEDCKEVEEELKVCSGVAEASEQA